MATTAEIAATARAMLRDFPQYFEAEEGPLNTLTIRLPHPLVSPHSLQVYVIEDGTSTLTDKWILDERNGLLKLTDEAMLGRTVVVAGYYYTWFSDSDLEMHAELVIAEMSYGTDTDIEDVAPVVAEVIAIGTVVRALWSLMLEFSFDIDVSTPEGMFIPARQRFQQVQQALQYWEAEFNNKSAALNIGLNSIEVFRLRRVAYMTGRYVPVYREREFDDPRPPERLYPAIPHGVPPSSEGESDIEEFLR